MSDQRYYQYRSMKLVAFESDEDCATGDGTLMIPIAEDLEGYSLYEVQSDSHTAGVTGTMDIQVRHRRAGSDNDVLDTKVQVASGATSGQSTDVNSYGEDLQDGDGLFVDFDTVQTTPAKGATVTLMLRKG